MIGSSGAFMPLSPPICLGPKLTASAGLGPGAALGSSTNSASIGFGPLKFSSQGAFETACRNFPRH